MAHGSSFGQLPSPQKKKKIGRKEEREKDIGRYRLAMLQVIFIIVSIYPLAGYNYTILSYNCSCYSNKILLTN